MSNYVENIKEFVNKKLLKRLIKKESNFKIKISDYFLNSGNDSKKFIRCVIKCLYDLKKETIIENYYFKVIHDQLVVNSKKNGNELEIKMKKYVKSIVESNQEWNELEENFNFNFFIKIVAIDYNDYFKSNIFKLENNKLRIINKNQSKLLMKDFIEKVENDCKKILEDEDLYMNFEPYDYSIPKELLCNQFCGILLSIIDENIKNKFKFSVNENRLNVEFNHCQKLFCNGYKCNRCHHLHEYGEFSNFLNFLTSLKEDNKGVYNDSKTLVYELGFNSDLLEFESEEEKNYYYLQRKLKKKGIEYDYDYLENKMNECEVLNIRNDFKSNYYEVYDLNNSVYEYLFKLDRLEIENLLLNYIENINLMLYLDYDKKRLHIKFDYWNNFLNDLKRCTTQEHFPSLTKNTTSFKSSSSLNSVWSNKSDWTKIGYCCWKFDKNNDLDENLDENLDEKEEKEIQLKNLKIETKFKGILEYQYDERPLSPYDIEVIRKCPTPTAIEHYKETLYSKKQEEDFDFYYDFNDSNYEDSQELEDLEESIEFEFSDDEENIIEQKKKEEKSKTKSIQEFFRRKKQFKSLKV